MSITKAVGTVYSIASTYGASKNMTAVSNANPAVATLESSHGVIVGDFIEITSGWGRLNGRVVRVSAVSTNDVTLEGVNTLSDDLYPATTGTGTVREITAWTALTQVTPNISAGGGEQNYADTTTLLDVVQKQIPTTRSPLTLTLPVFFDPAQSWVAVVTAAMDAASPVALKAVYPNSSRTIGNAYWSVQTTPTPEDSTLRSRVDLTFSADPITYST
jgi:hypothetical protein